MESYDLRAPALFLDPHPIFHRMRAEEPVFFSAALDAWVLTGYKDICAMLRDPRFSVMEEVKRIHALPAAEQEALLPLKNIFLSWAGRADEETHARFTKLLRRYFTPHYVASIRPRIQAHLDRLIAAALERGGGLEMDLASGVAHPLSITIVAELVGVPSDSASIDVYLECAEDIASMLEMGHQHQLHRSQRGMLRLCDKLAATVAARRAERKEDLISVFVEADPEGAIFTDLNIVSQCIMFLVVGYHTTANQLCDGLAALFDHPAELEKLKADLDRLPNAFEEMMRYHGAVASIRRLAEADVPIGDKIVRAGDTVVCVFAAANRDPEVFADPDRFDIGREGASKQIGFATGQYACLGQALARMEADVFFRTLLGRFPRLRRSGASPDWKVFRPFGKEAERFLVRCD